MVNLIALDPGTHTGVCIYSTETNGFEFDTLGPNQHHLPLWDLLTVTAPDVIIFERFTYQRRDKVILDSVEYIGVARLYSQLHRVPYAEQTPSSAKNLWTDDKIRTLGLWRPSERHAMDALRHMLYYLTVKKNDRQWVNKLRPS